MKYESDLKKYLESEKRNTSSRIMFNVKYETETLPEALRTQGIESMT